MVDYNQYTPLVQRDLKKWIRYLLPLVLSFCITDIWSTYNFGWMGLVLASLGHLIAFALAFGLTVVVSKRLLVYYHNQQSKKSDLLADLFGI